LATPSVDFDEPGYVRRVVETVRALPGVAAVGTIERRPFGHTVHTTQLTDTGRSSYLIYQNRVDPGFPLAAGIELRRGRFFSDEETAANAPVAVIGESVAQRFFEGDAIGQSLLRLPTPRPFEDVTVVGVVKDVVLNRLDSQGFGTIFRPIQPSGPETSRSSPPTLIVRTANPAALARAVEDAIRPLDSRVRPSTFVLQQDVDRMGSDKRMLAWLAGPVALLALVLAALGVYGVTAFVVSRRTQEVSVRMALGASSADVRQLLVRDSLRPVLVGLGAGLVVALGGAKVFASLFAGISPFDPLAIAVSLALLVLAALGAVMLPARAAARVDPAAILRES
jgi:ABC-type antimicrobial peptide transport system permease subunit